MGTVTWVAGDEEGNGDGSRSDGNGDNANDDKDNGDDNDARDNTDNHNDHDNNDRDNSDDHDDNNTGDKDKTKTMTTNNNDDDNDDDDDDDDDDNGDNDNDDDDDDNSGSNNDHDENKNSKVWFSSPNTCASALLISALSAVATSLGLTPCALSSVDTSPSLWLYAPLLRLNHANHCLEILHILCVGHDMGLVVHRHLLLCFLQGPGALLVVVKVTAVPLDD